MKKAKNFFISEERPNGGIFWNGVPVENLTDSRLKINEDVTDVSSIFKLFSIIQLTNLKKSKLIWIGYNNKQFQRVQITRNIYPNQEKLRQVDVNLLKLTSKIMLNEF